MSRLLSTLAILPLCLGSFNLPGINYQQAQQPIYAQQGQYRFSPQQSFAPHQYQAPPMNFAFRPSQSIIFPNYAIMPMPNIFAAQPQHALPVQVPAPSVVQQPQYANLAQNGVQTQSRRSAPYSEAPAAAGYDEASATTRQYVNHIVPGLRLPSNAPVQKNNEEYPEYSTPAAPATQTPIEATTTVRAAPAAEPTTKATPEYPEVTPEVTTQGYDAPTTTAVPAPVAHREPEPKKEKCYVNKDGFKCCNSVLEKFMRDLLDNPGAKHFAGCNLQRVSTELQLAAQARFNESFEAIVASGDSGTKGRFKGDWLCTVLTKDMKSAKLYATSVPYTTSVGRYRPLTPAEIIARGWTAEELAVSEI